MYDSIEHSDVRIAFQEFVVVFPKNVHGSLRVGRAARCIVLVADLKDKLIERLLLFAVFDVIVVVFDAAVFPFLLGIILRQRRTEQVIVCIFEVFTSQNDVILDALFVHILREELSVVVGYAPLANAYAYSFLHRSPFSNDNV